MAKPNFHVKYDNKYQLNIFVNYETRQNLTSDNPRIRKEAQNIVCSRFYRACLIKFSGLAPKIVTWSHITVTPLK